MIKILHAADLHLDSPFSGLSPEQAALRRKEQRQLPARLAELARIYGCDLFLLAGSGMIASFLGQLLGFKAGKYMNQKMFVRFVLAFLTLSAIVLFHKAIT